MFWGREKFFISLPRFKSCHPTQQHVFFVRCVTQESDKSCNGILKYIRAVLAGAKEELSLMGQQESQTLIFDTSLCHGNFFKICA
jgi:hypothetical protein